jgi:hypothetical protein
MANASTTEEAPLKKTGASAKDKVPTKEDLFLAQVFDTAKKYMFELAVENMPRQTPVWNVHSNRPEPQKTHKPYRNIVMTSQIIWNGQRRGIRYYDGCDSIFIDEQPKEKDTIEQFIRQTPRRAFIDGKFGVFGDERLLLLFMLAASFNQESPFRTRTADIVYRPVDSAKKASIESDRLDLAEKALEAAKTVSLSKLMIHADYLGIPLKDFDSDNDLSEQEIRIAYRKEALRDPKNFMASYGNKALETKYFIKKALSEGLLDTKYNPNKVVWSSSKREVCDISGLKSFAAISERLFEFSQLEDGEEFKIQLSALYNP